MGFNFGHLNTGDVVGTQLAIFNLDYRHSKSFPCGRPTRDALADKDPDYFVHPIAKNAPRHVNAAIQATSASLFNPGIQDFTAPDGTRLRLGINHRYIVVGIKVLILLPSKWHQVSSPLVSMASGITSRPINSIV